MYRLVTKILLCSVISGILWACQSPPSKVPTHELGNGASDQDRVSHLRESNQTVYSKPPLQIEIEQRANNPHYSSILPLTAQDIVWLQPLTEEQVRINGGQFSLRLDVRTFPINAPKCREVILLRMPWTDIYTPRGKDNIEQKVELYRAIRDLHLAPDKHRKLPVKIALSPYAASDNGKIYLTRCNVFFYDRRGRYVEPREK